MSRYSICAMGMINALGNHCGEIATRLFAGETNRMTPHTLRTTGRTVPVGKVHGQLPELPAELSRFQCRNNTLAYAAFLQIEDRVTQLRERFGATRVAVVVGSSTSGIDTTEAAFSHWRETGGLPTHFHYDTQHEMGCAARLLAELGGLCGPAYTISTACSSSAKVFASARGLLDLDLCDAVLVGGADSLCHITLNGFEALASLSDEVSNPFSANRRGLNIGEGAALFTLSREPGAIYLCGVGESCDAHHISAPHPEGVGAEASMSAALADAGLKPDEIAYINLHGTGTPLNDAMEAKAVQRVFGLAACGSTKPFTGHCLGAAGAIEVGFCVMSLQQRDADGYPLPPHPWDGVYDTKLPRLELNTQHIGRPQPTYIMSNSFAFGGNNCSVIVGCGEAP